MFQQRLFTFSDMPGNYVNSDMRTELSIDKHNYYDYIYYTVGIFMHYVGTTEVCT